MNAKVYHIGTRGSPLALAQAKMVAEALPFPSELVIVKTAGDREQRKPLAELGGKGVWTKELERALLDGEIDMAVHSMKDVESERPAGLFIAAMLPRADVRDRLIGRDSLSELRAGMTVGTSSPRRAAQLQRLIPGLNIVPFRGNVARRLERVTAGEADATLLAAAGLDRLGAAHGTPIETSVMLPAPGQGAVGIEVRADNGELREILASMSHAATFTAVSAERAMARALGGSCHSPVAALALEDDGGFTLSGEILSTDGRLIRQGVRHFPAEDAARAGDSLGRELLADAPPELARLFDGLM